MRTCPINKLHKVQLNKFFNNSDPYYVCTVCKKDLSTAAINHHFTSVKILSSKVSLYSEKDLNYNKIVDLGVDLLKDAKTVYYINKSGRTIDTTMLFASKLSGIPFKNLREFNLSDTEKQIYDDIQTKYNNSLKIKGKLSPIQFGVNDLIDFLSNLKTSQNDEILIEHFQFYFADVLAQNKPALTDTTLNAAYARLMNVAQDKGINIKIFLSNK
jgi:hypothetical protein